MCCKLTGAGQDSLDTSCTAPAGGLDGKVTALSSPTNAHVEKPGEIGGYSNYVCISAVTGTVLCETKTSCNSEESCVFTQSDKKGFTNAHAADCTITNAYPLKNCCRYYPVECGGLGEPCCSGNCDPTTDPPLTCLNNVCEPPEEPCPNNQCDVGEDDPDSPNYCPIDCDLPGPATVWGTVTDVAGANLEGAAVTVVGKAGATDSSDAAGYYKITVNEPSDGSPYDVTASLAGYETSTATGIILTDWDSVQQDFTLLKPADGCNADCTKDDFCRAECSGKGLCVYKSQEIADACEFAVPGIIDDPNTPGNQIMCCTGGSYKPFKANIDILCEGNVLSARRPVLFRGKLASMVIVVFENTACKEAFLTGNIVKISAE